MSTLKAVVQDGRAVIDGMEGYPDGTVLTVVIVDDGDDLDDEERSKLHESLRRGLAEAKAGLARPVEELLEEL